MHMTCDARRRTPPMISMVTEAEIMTGRSARSSTVIRRVNMPQVFCGFSALTPHLVRLPNEPLRAPSGRIPGAAGTRILYQRRQYRRSPDELVMQQIRIVDTADMFGRTTRNEIRLRCDK